MDTRVGIGVLLVLVTAGCASGDDDGDNCPMAPVDAGAGTAPIDGGSSPRWMALKWDCVCESPTTIDGMGKHGGQTFNNRVCAHSAPQAERFLAAGCNGPCTSCSCCRTTIECTASLPPESSPDAGGDEP